MGMLLYFNKKYACDQILTGMNNYFSPMAEKSYLCLS